MIFPKRLQYVTVYLPEAEQYYELEVSSSRIEFVIEPFYNRQAISAKKDFSIRGVRMNFELSFEQTRQHNVIRDMWNDLYSESQGLIRMYLRSQSDIDVSTDYFEVLVADFVSSTSYRNTISRTGYTMNMTSVITDFGIGLVYLVDNDEVIILNNDSDKMLVNLVNY